MIFDRLEPAGRIVVRPRSSTRERKHSPTLHRDRFTAHEDGCGGVWFNVTYVGGDVGAIRSCWSLRDGVHWQAIAGGVIVDKDSSRPKAYPSKDAAINALLERAGWRGDYVTPTYKYDFIGRKVGT